VSTVKCAKCGACSAVCPVFRSSGRESHTARGKLHLLDVLGLAKASTEFVDIFSACLLCGACSAICPRSIDISKALVSARESFSSVAGPHGYEKYLTRKLLAVPGSLAGLRVLGSAGEKLLSAYLPKESGLRLRLAMFADTSQDQPSSEKKHPHSRSSENTKTISWFPGCTARYLSPDSLDSCSALFAERGVALSFSRSLACCGLADWAAGDSKEAQKKGRQNIQVLEESDGPIMVSCASCLAQLQYYPKLFDEESEWRHRAEKIVLRLMEFSSLLGEHEVVKRVESTATDSKIRVFYHDPCHMRHNDQIVDCSREQLRKSGNIEILELPDGPRCCGQGGLFHIAQPEISGRIRDQLVQDVLRLEPDVITTSCSGCLMQWQQGLAAAGSTVRAKHLAQVLEDIKAT
jgi:glycolate dehydrogenase iron-sulfur subunit